MTDSKLITLLKCLGKEEFREFEKFAASPYFRRDRDIMPLLKELKPFHPEFSDEDLTVEFLFAKIFPGKKFEEKKSYNVIKTLSSQLFKLGKDFLIQLELNEDKKGKEYYLLNQLRKKKLYKEFDREYEDSLLERENTDKGNVKDFAKNYLINTVLTDNFLDKDDFDNALENTFMMSERIIAGALICCFKFEDEKNIAKGYNKDTRFTLMNALLENLNTENLLHEIEKNNGNFYAYIKIYYMIYRMNKHKDKTEYYYETKALLEKNFHLFGQSENHVLWNMMMTYCNMKNFTDEDAIFRKELNWIYKKILSLGIYKRKAEEDFHIVLFRNIVLSASSLREYEWLEEFINKFSDEIHIDHREDMKNFSHAYLNFLKGEYEKALEYVIKVGFDLFLYKHDVKVLQIRIYYELNYLEEALSLIDALHHYLKSTKDIPDHHKPGYKNFLNCMKELFRIRNGGKIDLKELEYLEHKVNMNSKYGLKWVMEKIRELKGE